MSDDRVRVETTHAWVEPMAVAAGLSDRDGLVCLLSGDGRSIVAAEPDLVEIVPAGMAASLEALRKPALDRNTVALISYDSGARPATGDRAGTWPDLVLARYPAMLVFDPAERTVCAVAVSPSREDAEAACQRAANWLGMIGSVHATAVPAATFEAEDSAEAYQAAVRSVVGRIGAGDLFQANIARAWGGSLRADADPFDVFSRLVPSAPFGAYWRIGDQALVSNSPELFVTLDRSTGRLETRPIKGTRGRDADPARDAALLSDLVASTKDRAENLMIVDLMRNDLARVCVPGSVEVERLFDVESHPGVHHLVSTVTGLVGPAVGPVDVLEATFPPGSITGAPKHQAMKVIAQHERPRGPWCGSLVFLDAGGDMTASVLIRTASFTRQAGVWSYRTLAGAGIVADSVPSSELAETEVKISALRTALAGPI